MDPAPSPTVSPAPQPQTRPGASTHGRQPAASRAAAIQAHPEPRQRHGTPDRPTEAPLRRHVPLPRPTPPAPGPPAPSTPTPTTPLRAQIPRLRRRPARGAQGNLQTTAQAEPASQGHLAPPAGLAVRPTEPSSPGRPAPNLDPGPDRAHTTVLADALRSAGPGSRPGPPPVSEGHA